MSEFDSPAASELNNIFIEPVYAGSGTKETETELKSTGGDDWDIHCEWRNHNTGHHSELAIIGKHHGKNGGNTLTMDMYVNGFRLDNVIDKGGMTVTNICETGFTVTRNNWYNPSDQFEFNIQLTAKDSVYYGSVGKTGEYTPCSVICVNYYGA